MPSSRSSLSFSDNLLSDGVEDNRNARSYRTLENYGPRDRRRRGSLNNGSTFEERMQRSTDKFNANVRRLLLMRKENARYERQLEEFNAQLEDTCRSLEWIRYKIIEPKDGLMRLAMNEGRKRGRHHLLFDYVVPDMDDYPSPNEHSNRSEFPLRPRGLYASLRPTPGHVDVATRDHDSDVFADYDSDSDDFSFERVIANYKDAF